MFRIDNSDTFKWPVSYNYPGTDGKRKTDTFTGVFKRQPESYVNGALTTSEKSIEDVVKDVFVGFEDVQTAEGNPMEATAENIAALLNLAGMPSAVFQAYFDASAQGKAKN